MSYNCGGLCEACGAKLASLAFETIETFLLIFKHSECLSRTAAFSFSDLGLRLIITLMDRNVGLARFFFISLEEKFYATVLHPRKEDEDRESLSFYEMGHKKVEVFTLCPRWNVLLVKMVRN